MTGLGDVRRALGVGQRDAALAVKCPHCHAQPGARCSTPSGKRVLPDPHPSRIDAGPALALLPSNVIPLFREET